MMRVYVTREDIRRGMPEDECGCPIQRAVKRRLGPNAMVRVWGYVHVNGRAAYNLSDEASDFLDDFDAGRPVKPCVLELEAT